MHSRFTKAAAGFFAGLSVLCCIELAVRLAGVSFAFAWREPREFFEQDFEDKRHVKDPELFWRLRPELRLLAADGGVSYRWDVNSQGFREPYLVSTAQKPGVPRVLCIGDSVPFGWMVDREQAYPALLQTELQRAGLAVEVVNAAVPGYSSHQTRVYLEGYLKRFEADVIVTYLGINDSNPALLTDRQRAPLVRWDVRMSRLRLYRMIRAVARTLLAPPKTASAVAQSLPAIRVPLEEMIENLEAIARQCERRGSKLVMVEPAVLGERTLAEARPRPRDAMKPGEVHARYEQLLAKHHGVSTRAALAPHAEDARELLVPNDPCHWNAKGNLFLAQALARTIAPLLSQAR